MSESANTEGPFIAFDWCGRNGNYGRFTYVDRASGTSDTLVQRTAMGQYDWDKAQLEWFRKYPGLTVYRCPGAYHPNDNVMGTVDEIIERLAVRVV